MNHRPRKRFGQNFLHDPVVIGGGAIVWAETPAGPAPALPQPRRARAAIMALAHDLALAPFTFGWVASLPGLHVGETRFEPEFSREGLSGGTFALAQSALDRIDVQNAERRNRAEAFADRIGAETRFQPLLAPAARDLAARLITVPARIRAESRRGTRVVAALRTNGRG